jgi:hypothetical protein
MWDVLSADFDQSITQEKCLEYVLLNLKPQRCNRFPRQH